VRRAALLLAALGALALARPALARPFYFETLVARFGLTEESPVYACGVCHYKWTGTGGRNPFGSSIEQELYAGKSIGAAIEAAVALDPDADGFTSLEELESYETLPGYSCANLFDAVDPPDDWHAFVTPLVLSCFDPKGIRVEPTALSLKADVGESATGSVVVHNSGKDDPIEVSSYQLLASVPGLGVEGPAVPFTVPVGQKVALTLRFEPEAASLVTTALRIESDDPDPEDARIDVAVSVLGRIQPLASAEKRAACLRDVDKQMRRFTGRHLAEWSRCQGDEAAGVACDGGARDRRLLDAASGLHRVIGGARDARCDAANITPLLLGQPEVCGGGCGAIELGDFTDLADCLVCRQEEETRKMLGAALGAAPPDLPPVAAQKDAMQCARRILKALEKGIARTQKLLGACELANVAREEPLDCKAALAADLGAVAAGVDARLARCKDTTGLAGCYAGDGDATCLGAAAVAIGSTLVDAEFGGEEAQPNN
jgi:hypothetical protein